MAKGKYTREVLELIDLSISNFTKVTKGTGMTIFNKIVKELAVFDITKGGTIKPTVNNLKKIKALQNDIRKIILSKKYVQSVADFLNSFNKVEKKNTAFFRTFSKDFNPKTARLDFVTANAIERTEASLLGSGIDNIIIDPIISQIRSNIGIGSRKNDLIETIQNFITETDTLGTLERYSKQIATDSLNIFHAERIRAGAEDLGLEWYLYTGGLIKTSREFCEERNGKYFHQSEVEKWAGEKWAGKNKNTNPSNIFILRGGYNCQHQLEPVSEFVVPKKDIDRIDNLKN